MALAEQVRPADAQQPTTNPVPHWETNLFLPRNNGIITDISRYLIANHPGSGAEILQHDANATELTPEAIAWGFKKFYGLQQGDDLGTDGKLPVGDAPELRELAGSIQFAGSYLNGWPLSESDVTPARDLTHMFIFGNTGADNPRRLYAGHDGSIESNGAETTVFLAGQRLRWNEIPSEVSVEILYNAVLTNCGIPADDHAEFLEQLRKASPFVRAEEEKDHTGNPNPWRQGYSTEYHMARLTVEVALLKEHGTFDWNRYQNNVEVTELDYGSEGAPNPTPYGATFGAPQREEESTTYHLADGKTIQVINAYGEPRPGNIFRPNGESTIVQAHEMIGGLPPESRVGFASTAPHHGRMGVEGLMLLMQLEKEQGRMNSIKTAEIKAVPWPLDIIAIAALSEIIAINKANVRFNAVLNDNDPNAPELAYLSYNPAREAASTAA